MRREKRLEVMQIASVVLLIVLDQLTKLWAVKSLLPIKRFPIIDGVFSLNFVENTGAAFSMLEGKTIFLTVIPLLACVAIVYVLATKKVKPKVGSWGLCLILAGALGNIIDRIFRGAVVDMLDFELINFPVFNVADIAVTIGAVLFFIYILFLYDDKAEKKDGKNLPDGGEER